MSDKTNEEIDAEFYKLFIGIEFSQAIAIAEWIDNQIDQEKRKEAIAFAEWAAEKGWLLHPDCDEDEERAFYKPSDDFDIPDELMFGGQLYDLYLQHIALVTKKK